MSFGQMRPQWKHLAIIQCYICRKPSTASQQKHLIPVVKHSGRGMMICSCIDHEILCITKHSRVKVSEAICLTAWNDVHKTECPQTSMTENILQVIPAGGETASNWIIGCTQYFKFSVWSKIRRLPTFHKRDTIRCIFTLRGYVT